MQPKTKQSQSPSNNPNIELQARDLDILKGLFESRLATLAQLAELYFDGKKEAAQNRVKKLKDAGFLKERPRANVGAPSIVHLSRRGFDTLTERHWRAAITASQLHRQSREPFAYGGGLYAATVCAHRDGV